MADLWGAEPPSIRFLKNPAELLSDIAWEMGTAIDLHCEPERRGELKADLECLLRKAHRAVQQQPRGVSDGV